MQGNDAAFTVQAMIGICFEAMFPDNRPTEADILADLEEDAASKIIKRAKEDHQEWKDADKDEPDESINVRVIPGSRKAMIMSQSNLRLTTKTSTQRVEPRTRRRIG